MENYKKPSDFKERFEFRLTVGDNDNIICGRYFKINNFNPLSESSEELVNTLRFCADMIDRDLKFKSMIYLDVMAPRVFDTESQMFKYFEDEYNKIGMSYGNGIVVKDEKSPNYVWGKNDLPEKLAEKFDNGEFTSELTDDDRVKYRLTFLDNGREVVSTMWEGIYPKYIRNSIDLTNKKGRYDGKDVMKLGFEAYLLNMMVSGRDDLVSKIINELLYVCSNKDNGYYTLSSTYGDKKYNFKTYSK